MIEVARFNSMQQDVFGHRRSLRKGESAEREQSRILRSWAYSEELYDCHRTAMGSYLKKRRYSMIL